MQFQTRKPTGKASFPLIVLSGVEGSGKTWAAVEATSMEAVDRAFFIEIGESMADEYGAVPGADFEIVEHDGTLGQIRSAIQWASEQPAAEGKYNMLIVDSMTEVWDMITANAQFLANQRSRRKRTSNNDEVRIGMDLWNRAADTWMGIMSQCRRFPGPVILTARLKLTVLVDDKGQPTKDKDWKIEAHKSLPWQGQVVMQARQPRVWTMTKIATANPQLQLQPGGEMTFNDFSVEKLLTAMGITSKAEQSTFVDTQTDGYLQDDEAPQTQQPQRAPEKPRDYWNAGKAPERTRHQWVAAFTQQLLSAENDRDAGKLQQFLDYVTKHSDGELVRMTQQTITRMNENPPAEEVHEAEVVDESGHPLSQPVE